MTGSEHPGVPLRHPRPLTAAELYDQCEKEQEAVVSINLQDLLSDLLDADLFHRSTV